MIETDKIVAAIFTAARMAGEKESNPAVYYEFYEKCIAENAKRRAKAREGKPTTIKITGA